MKEYLSRLSLAGLCLLSTSLTDVAGGGQRFSAPALAEYTSQIHHPVNLGFSFSSREANYLHLNPKKAFDTLASLGFSSVRISTFLDIPITQTENDLNWQLDEAAKYHLSTIVGIGPKSQHFPEFYTPNHLPITDPSEQALVLQKMKKILQRYGNDPRIFVWQLDNEPFDSFDSGNIPAEPAPFIQKMRSLINRYSSKPVLVTDFLSSGQNRSRWNDVLSVANIGGLDVYPQQNQTYLSGSLIHSVIRKDVSATQKANKKIVVSEIQTEEWGKGIYTADDFLHTFQTVAQDLPPDSTIFVWEGEKALAKSKKGDSIRLNTIKFLLQAVRKLQK